MASPLLLCPALLALWLAAIGTLPMGPAAAAGTASAAPDPWTALSRARAALVAGGPLAADFVQTFTPVGFDRGERESGRLALDLPRCLRWDYELPEAKSFLLCEGQLSYWIPGDPYGRRSAVDARHEPGLDLLLLPVEQLGSRYRATAVPAADGTLTVRLVPLAAEGSPLRDAEIAFDRSRTRPLRLAYHDDEGSLTELTLSGFRPLTDRSAFTPPTGIAWRQE